MSSRNYCQFLSDFVVMGLILLFQICIMKCLQVKLCKTRELIQNTGRGIRWRKG